MKKFKHPGSSHGGEEMNSVNRSVDYLKDLRFRREQDERDGVRVKRNGD